MAEYSAAFSLHDMAAEMDRIRESNANAKARAETKALAKAEKQKEKEMKRRVPATEQEAPTNTARTPKPSAPVMHTQTEAEHQAASHIAKIRTLLHNCLAARSSEEADPLCEALCAEYSVWHRKDVHRAVNTLRDASPSTSVVGAGRAAAHDQALWPRFVQLLYQAGVYKACGQACVDPARPTTTSRFEHGELARKFAPATMASRDTDSVARYSTGIPQQTATSILTSEPTQRSPPPTTPTPTPTLASASTSTLSATGGLVVPPTPTPTPTPASAPDTPEEEEEQEGVIGHLGRIINTVFFFGV